MPDVYAKWQQLCKEHDDARDEYFLSFIPVNKKFSQIFQGISNTNPSDEELSKFEAAWDKWQDVKRRMDEFIKVNV